MIWGIRGFIRSLKRATSWFLFMWSNEEWDQCYLYLVIQRKLKDMQKMWGNKDNIHIIEKARIKNWRDITHCIGLIENIINDSYILCNEYDKYFKKWGGLKWKSISNDCMQLDGHENEKTEKDKKFSRVHFSRVNKLMDSRRKYDKDKLFEILNKNIDGWWD